MSDDPIERDEQLDAFAAAVARGVAAQKAVDEQLARYPVGSQPVETSEDAADMLVASGALARRRREVLCFVASRPTGATADEIALAFDCPHNSTSPRLTELVSMGYIEKLDGNAGRRRYSRQTRSGASAWVHQVTPAGRTLIRRLADYGMRPG